MSSVILPRREQRREGGAHAVHQVRHHDPAGGRQVLGQLDARQAEQVVDQPVHALRLLGHDAEELGLRRRVIGGGAAQRVDEADQAGQRRAQLVAGIGDEIRPHPLDRPVPRAVGEHGDDPPPRPGGLAGMRQHHRVQLAGDRQRQAEIGELVLALSLRAFERGAEARVPQQGGHAGTEGGLRRRVEPVHRAVGADDDQRVRQPVDDGLLGVQLLLQRFDLGAQLLALPLGARRGRSARGRSGALSR